MPLMCGVFDLSGTPLVAPLVLCVECVQCVCVSEEWMESMWLEEYVVYLE